jgi:hypothetical protein
VNELSLFLGELDATMGDLHSRTASSLVVTSSSSAAADGVNATTKQAEEQQQQQQQQQTSSDHSPLRQSNGETARVVTAVESTTGTTTTTTTAAISTTPVQAAKKDLRLDRFFKELSNKTVPRNGVPVLRKGSRQCRTMTAHQRIEKQSNASSSLLASTSSVEFIGCCGLGHRLARMAAAAHLSIKLETALYGDALWT